MSTAREAVGGAVDSARDTGYGVINVIQQNPIPTAMIAGGLGWLWMNARRPAPAGPRYTEASYSPGMGASAAQPGGMIQSARDAAGDLLDSAQDRAGQMLDSARDTAGQVADSARQAMGSAMDTARDVVGGAVDTARNTGSGAMDLIQQNPIPAALLAASAAWLWLGSRQQGAAASNGSQSDLYGYGRGSAATSPAGDQSGTLSGVGQVVQAAQDRAGAVVDQVQQQVGQIGSQAQQQAQQAMDGLQRLFQQHPLSVAAVAATVGAAVGLAVPETRREQQLMGEARDRLVDQVQQTAQDLGQRAQSVAQEAANAARDEAKNQGLTA